ncbi:hypothetical protein [Paenibacillus sp. Cedars]|uniref:hypothetical protein n=1 Tax=Paenibacillus sp. Cedars TaxID=1980674 RepID=UPI0015623110|nr:hypothetical protein [Paenibacillus sp. Cedars]
MRLLSYFLLGSLSLWESLLVRCREEELLRAFVELHPAGIALPLGVASHAGATSIERL